MAKRNPLFSDKMYLGLPFERGSFILDVKSIRYYAGIDRSHDKKVKTVVRRLGFDHEVLIIGVTLSDGDEEDVLLHVEEQQLIVACDAGTTEEKLSLHAYYALMWLVKDHGYFDFHDYYWPDFFEKFSKSKYLEIEDGWDGLKISLKPEYSSFVRPFDNLPYPTLEHKYGRPSIIFDDKEHFDSVNNNGIGFCIVISQQLETKRLPFLIPYSATTSKDGRKVSSVKQFIKPDTNAREMDLSLAQEGLLLASIQMQRHVEVIKKDQNFVNEVAKLVESRNNNNLRQVFEYWQKALPALTTQPHTHHLSGYDNLKGKPVKKHFTPCKFSYEVPKICFLMEDKTEYWELSYSFKVYDKVKAAVNQNLLFFISSKDEPNRFYLFKSMTDCLITSFFAERQFKIQILKKHYKRFFMGFIFEMLCFYEITDSNGKKVDIDNGKQ